MHWIHLIIFFPILLAIVVPFLRQYFPGIHTGWFVLTVPFLIFISLTTYIPGVASGDSYTYTLPWITDLDIHLTMYVDGLSLLFALLISGIGILVTWYSIYYLSKKKEVLHTFYIYLLLFMTAMLGLVFSDNLMVMYLFWELTSISSFLLIAYWHHRQQSRYGAQKAMLITFFGGFSLLAGIILLRWVTGTFSVREIIASSGEWMGHPLILPTLVLFLVAAFTKSAQFPFHIWLPDAMEAPTPISAYLHSATMVKAGIYLVARFTPVFAHQLEWFWLVTGVGLITLFWGSFNAVKQTDLKALLAYSTISQLGLIMSLLGIGSLAIASDQSTASTVFTTATLAAVFHLVNHSTFKGALFMVVGIIDHETGTRDTRKLNGLLTVMPISFTLMVIGSLSMAGLPPFNGFLSKELFFTGTLSLAEFGIPDWFTVATPFIAWTASILTFVYCMMLMFHTFLGKTTGPPQERQGHEPAWGMLAPPVLLAVLIIGIFFVPNVLGTYVIKPAMASILQVPTTQLDVYISAWHGFNLELLMTLGVVVFGLALFVSHRRWVSLVRRWPATFTWSYAYHSTLHYSERCAAFITSSYMNGSTRNYIMYLYVLVIGFVGTALTFVSLPALPLQELQDVSVYGYMLAFALVFASFIVVLTSKRMVGITAVGVVGYLIALFFMIFRAPDLALTQFAVETISVVLFLLCLRHMPKIYYEAPPLYIRLIKTSIAVGLGGLITALALYAYSGRTTQKMSDYFLQAYEETGISNMVNAILADYRGIDTLLEIMVLGIAGLGIYGLIRLQEKEPIDRDG